MSSPPAIVWFRQDLRLSDNPALIAAAHGGRPVVPVFILDDEAAGRYAVGAASRWWLHGSLEALAHGLERIGAHLLLRRGDTLANLRDIAGATGAIEIHAARSYQPGGTVLEARVAVDCSRAGRALHLHPGRLLHDPDTLRTKAGEPFRVFTPFYRTLLDSLHLGSPLAAPARLSRPERLPSSEPLESWQLRPTRPDWAGGLRATWTPGEAGGAVRLQTLISTALKGYASERNRPDQEGTSRLSPHLHFGEVSPRQCWHAIAHSGGPDALSRKHVGPKAPGGSEAFLREIGWREFSYHLLHNNPTLPDVPFRREFARFPYDHSTRSDAHLRAWSRGHTGYPIVDAGMRQLWETGWMHNRVRMLTASFLTKHLLISWQRGWAWFWDTLVDADLANNSASWQWVAGSGADAAPFFRIFNPVLQGAKFDPDGDYVRRFVPELARLGPEHIHAPWEAPPLELAAAGVRLGDTYPHPIVDHGKARAMALAAFEAIKK